MPGIWWARSSSTLIPVSFLTGCGARLCGSPTAAGCDNAGSAAQAIDAAAVARKKQTRVAKRLTFLLKLVMASLCVPTGVWSSDGHFKISTIAGLGRMLKLDHEETS